MNRLEKVIMITNMIAHYRCHTCNSFSLDLNRILNNTINYNKNEVEAYVKILIENKNALDPYYRANILIKKHFDYPKDNMYE